MLKWIVNKLQHKAAEREVAGEMKHCIDYLNDNGGSDKLILSFLTTLYTNTDVRDGLATGTLHPSKYPVDRLLLGIACMQSMMQARKELLDPDLSEEAMTDAQDRLAKAEKAFVVGYTLLDKSDIRSNSDQAQAMVDTRIKEGKLALQNWRATDPRKFPIMAKVHLELDDPNETFQEWKAIGREAITEVARHTHLFVEHLCGDLKGKIIEDFDQRLAPMTTKEEIEVAAASYEPYVVQIFDELADTVIDDMPKPWKEFFEAANMVDHYGTVIRLELNKMRDDVLAACVERRETAEKLVFNATLSRVAGGMFAKMFEEDARRQKETE